MKWRKAVVTITIMLSAFLFGAYAAAMYRYNDPVPTHRWFITAGILALALLANEEGYKDH
jgi:hypothetical protein